MVDPEVINSSNTPIVWNFEVANGPTVNGPIVVTLQVPVEFTITSIIVPRGTIVGNVWTIPSMTPGETITPTVIVKLTGTPESFDETYLFRATVSGPDTLTGNNFKEDEVRYKLQTLTPLGGTNPDNSSCLCVDVSANDTPCTEGTSEWRINEGSIVNGILQSWDVLTGKGNFTRNDPSLPLTFTYDLYCVQGESELQVSCGEIGTIYPSIVDKDVFDPTFAPEDYEDLTAPDKLVLQGLRPDINVADFCWYLLRNADGDIIGGIPLNCDATLNTKFTHQKVNTLINLLIPETGVTFPTTPQEGDVHFVTFTNGYIVFTFGGSSWGNSISATTVSHSLNVLDKELTIAVNGVSTVVDLSPLFP